MYLRGIKVSFSYQVAARFYIYTFDFLSQTTIFSTKYIFYIGINRVYRTSQIRKQ